MEDVEEEVELWAINEPSFVVFDSLSTQWRVGMNGPTGLDYAAVPPVLDLLGIKGRKRRRDVFEDLRVLEREALATMREARE